MSNTEARQIAELKTCPFCGGEARLEEGNRKTEYIRGFNVLQEPTHDAAACQTSECAARMYRARVNGKPGFENLKQRWNARADSEKVAALEARYAGLESVLKVRPISEFGQKNKCELVFFDDGSHCVMNFIPEISRRGAIGWLELARIVMYVAGRL